MKINNNLLDCLDFGIFSEQYIKPEVCDAYYLENLLAEGRRTRSDTKISCQNIVILTLFWVLNPEDSYLSLLNKLKTLMLKTTNDVTQALKSITAAGLCKARKRFSSEIFKKIWQFQVLGLFIKEKGIKLWKGFQTCAVDGTALVLNRSKEIMEKYPPMDMARLPSLAACLLYDVFSKIPLDIVFDKFPSGERQMLCKLIRNIKTKTLLLLDRGYFAVWLFHKLKCTGIEFITRADLKFHYTIIKTLGKSDWLIEIKFSHGMLNTMRKRLSNRDLLSLKESMTLRMVKTQIRGHQARTIITSLLDHEIYSYDEICKLYCDRWIIENYYRDLKHVLKVTKFHSKHVDGIHQEIYASMILTVILQKHMLNASIKYKIVYSEISFKRAFEFFSNFLFFSEYLGISGSIIQDALEQFLATNPQKKRPGRSYKRIFFRKIKCKSNKWK
jgi:hypothetical protein